MNSIEFKPEVYEDIKIAYDWYEKQRIGLGEDFLLTLEASYAKIVRMPKAYQPIYKTVRRKLTRRFPYGVFFTLQDSQIIIIAVMHTKRNPSDWNERL
ncbi:Plasmid stabilization system protein [hydrothermal vent metagenome]|uniref:Plasmid stabilization system protein n=1 Tax=hydrothermal vent metagenome TaxID=652676 RepID=A0A1W1C808_9ZZZZ